MVPAGAAAVLRDDAAVLAAVRGFARLPEPWRSEEITRFHFGGKGSGDWVPLPFPAGCEKVLDAIRGRWHRRQVYSAALNWAAGEKAWRSTRT